MKPLLPPCVWVDVVAAAFGRLCVETSSGSRSVGTVGAAAFGRLCVETSPKMAKASDDLAAAFGRLCVETFVKCTTPSAFVGSRLRAAVC